MSYSLDLVEFWKTNEKCMNLMGNIPRVPVSLELDGDWICEYLKLDNAKYYSDFEYQQEQKLRCSEITQKELGYCILPDIDFGVVMDSSVYGGEVNYESNATPTLRPVISDPSQIDGLVEKMDRTDILECGLVPEFLEWREKLKARYGINVRYGTGIKGCATALGQICGITNFLTWIMTDPEEIRKLIACWLEVSKRYVVSLRNLTQLTQEHTGFSFASDVTGLLSPETYSDFIKNAEKEIYDMFCPDPADLRLYHADSHMSHQLKALYDIGVNAVNIDPYIEPRQIFEKMPETLIYGQIPPTKTLLYGTPEEIVECARMNIQQAGPGRKLVLTTAGSINPGTSFENLKAMCYAAEKYGYIYQA